MTGQDVVWEYQRRRRIAFGLGLPLLLLGGVGFYTGVNLFHSQAMSWGGFALAGAGVLVVATQLRCPACGALPMAWMWGRKGLLLNPAVCPSCGARLGAGAVAAPPVRRSRKWTNLGLAVVGVFALGLAWDSYDLERHLGGTDGAVARGVIDELSVSSGRGHEVTLWYSFRTADRRVRGHYQCGCPLLRHARPGDSLDLRYAVIDPDLSRPADAAPVPAFLILMALGGLVMGTVGVAGMLRRAS